MPRLATRLARRLALAGALALLSPLALLLSAAPASAAQQSVTLKVPDMVCASCPYIVRHALSAVPGVEKVAIDLDARAARVTYDPGRTSPERLAKAVHDAGYAVTTEAQ